MDMEKPIQVTAVPTFALGNLIMLCKDDILSQISKCVSVTDGYKAG